MIDRAVWFTGRTWMLPTTAQTKVHGGRSQCRLRVRASVTQSTRSYTIYPWKKIVSPEPHKATDTSHSKVLGFVTQLHEMQCESLDYTAEGFGASDVQSHQPWFQENVNIKVQEPHGIRKNQSNLKKSSNTTEGYAAATLRHKKAVDCKWLKLDRWFYGFVQVRFWETETGLLYYVIAMITLVPRCRRPE